MVWRLGSILGLLPAPSPPYLYQGRQLARIKAQHRIRQGLHQPRFNERRHSLIFVQQSHKGIVSHLGLQSADQRKRHCQQDTVKNFSIKSDRKHPFKGQRIKCHDTETCCNIRHIFCRKPTGIPQTDKHSKRTHSINIRNIFSLQVIRYSVIQKQRIILPQQLKLVKPFKLHAFKLKQEQLQQRKQL